MKSAFYDFINFEPPTLNPERFRNISTIPEGGDKDD
jgi:hypothetical protein